MGVAAASIRNIKRDVDLLLSILPFEAEWYKARDVTTLNSSDIRYQAKLRRALAAKNFAVATISIRRDRSFLFFPAAGSKELQRILPPMIEAIKELRDCTT